MGYKTYRTRMQEGSTSTASALRRPAKSRSTKKDAVEKRWHGETDDQDSSDKHKIPEDAMARFDLAQFLRETTQPLRVVALLRSEMASAVEMRHVVVIAEYIR